MIQIIPSLLPHRLQGVKNLQKRLDRGKTLLDGFVIELRELSPSEAAPFRAVRLRPSRLSSPFLTARLEI